MKKYYIVERMHPEGSREYLESFRLEDYFTANPFDSFGFSTIEQAEEHMNKYFESNPDKLKYIIHTVYC